METRTREFSHFFSLRVVHAWFGGATCPYISLEPDADCRLLLARKRMICKNVAGGLEIIAEMGAREEAPIARREVARGTDEPDHYRFFIRLDDTAFFPITRLDFADYPRQLFCFSNTAKSNRLSVKKYQNPDRNREAILGMVDISLVGNPPDTGAQEAFLLSFEAAPASSRAT